MLTFIFHQPANLGMKKVVENYAIRLADDNPKSQIDWYAIPQRSSIDTIRPDAVTIWIFKDGFVNAGISVLNPK